MSEAQIRPSRWRKILFIVIILAGAFMLLARPLLWWYFTWKLKPSKTFAASTAPPAPDYNKTSSWAALPSTKDYADFTPKGVTLSKKPRKADTFFVYPTTYMSGKSWNAPIDEAKSKKRVDTLVMKHQASAFNGCCDVYAPRYRQATLYFAFGFEPDGKKALELAYSDVVKAFKHYIKHWNKGRPFILAGHSQGTIHALRLLEEHIANTPLRHQLVAAYLPGNPVHNDKFKRTLTHLKVCNTPLDTHCVISWHTLDDKADIKKYSKLQKFYPPKGYEKVEGRPHVCVNPLSWKAQDPKAHITLHLGAIPYNRGDKPLSEPTSTAISGGCKDNAMRLKIVNVKGFNRFIFGKGDYHIYDYNLFYMNIRKNAEERVNAFINTAKTETKPTKTPAKVPTKSTPKTPAKSPAKTPVKTTAKTKAKPTKAPASPKTPAKTPTKTPPKPSAR